MTRVLSRLASSVTEMKPGRWEITFSVPSVKMSITSCCLDGSTSMTLMNVMGLDMTSLLRGDPSHPSREQGIFLKSWE